MYTYKWDEEMDKLPYIHGPIVESAPQQPKPRVLSMEEPWRKSEVVIRSGAVTCTHEPVLRGQASTLFAYDGVSREGRSQRSGSSLVGAQPAPMSLFGSAVEVSPTERQRLLSADWLSRNGSATGEGAPAVLCDGPGRRADQGFFDMEEMTPRQDEVARGRAGGTVNLPQTNKMIDHNTLPLDGPQQDEIRPNRLRENSHENYHMMSYGTFSQAWIAETRPSCAGQPTRPLVPPSLPAAVPPRLCVFSGLDYELAAEAWSSPQILPPLPESQSHVPPPHVQAPHMDIMEEEASTVDLSASAPRPIRCLDSMLYVPTTTVDLPLHVMLDFDPDRDTRTVVSPNWAALDAMDRADGLDETHRESPAREPVASKKANTRTDTRAEQSWDATTGQVDRLDSPGSFDIDLDVLEEARSGNVSRAVLLFPDNNIGTVGLALRERAGVSPLEATERVVGESRGTRHDRAGFWQRLSCS